MLLDFKRNPLAVDDEVLFFASQPPNFDDNLAKSRFTFHGYRLFLYQRLVLGIKSFLADR